MYNSYVTTSADMALFAVGGAMLIWMIIGCVLGILMIIGMWKLFTKAGKPGWASLIPIYNLIVYLQIAGLSPWLILLCIVPFVNFIAAPVIGILANVKLAKAFGKSGGFAVGLIFLNSIFLLILAFGSAEYQGTEA